MAPVLSGFNHVRVNGSKSMSFYNMAAALYLRYGLCQTQVVITSRITLNGHYWRKMWLIQRCDIKKIWRGNSTLGSAFAVSGPLKRVTLAHAGSSPLARRLISPSRWPIHVQSWRLVGNQWLLHWRQVGEPYLISPKLWVNALRLKDWFFLDLYTNSTVRCRFSANFTCVWGVKKLFLDEWKISYCMVFLEKRAFLLFDLFNNFWNAY